MLGDVVADHEILEVIYFAAQDDLLCKVEFYESESQSSPTLIIFISMHNFVFTYSILS